MKQTKYLLFAIFLVLSFYFTDKIMFYIDNKNPIMQSIIKVEDEYNIKAVNAIIKDNTIIPGLKGKTIDKHKSLLKMEEFGSFNANYLVYNLTNPDISLKDNKDRLIIKGNEQKRQVSLILEENPALENYLNDNNIKYDILARLDTHLNIKNREYINSEIDEKRFSDLNSILNKNKINSEVCLTNYSNNSYCRKNNYYLVTYSLNTFDKYSLINNVNSGDIILVSQYSTIDTLKLVLNEIKRLDLQIVFLSDLISE